MHPNKNKTKINIIQNEVIQSQTNKSLPRRMTSSMYFLDEEPVYTDSESEFSTELPECSENEIVSCVGLERNVVVHSESLRRDNRTSLPQKRLSDMEVQCDILTTTSNLKEIVQLCANLEAAGEYKELISVCKKLKKKIDKADLNVNKDKFKILVPSSPGKSTIKGCKKTIISAKQVAGVRKPYKKRKVLSIGKKIPTNDSSRNNWKSQNCETEEFLMPKFKIPTGKIKTMARNWMNPNKSFTALDKSICEPNYLSLQYPKTRRLYSPTHWMNSEEFMNCR